MQIFCRLSINGRRKSEELWDRSFVAFFHFRSLQSTQYMSREQQRLRFATDDVIGIDQSALSYNVADK